MRNLLCKTSEFLRWKIYLHMCRMFSEVFKNFVIWRPQYIMYFVDLVEFIVARKQRA